MELKVSCGILLLELNAKVIKKNEATKKKSDYIIIMSLFPPFCQFAVIQSYFHKQVSASLTHKLNSNRKSLFRDNDFCKKC